MKHISINHTITTPEERNRGFMVLFVSLICIGMGKTVLFSILPPLAREMGLTELQVGAIFATNAGAWVIFSPIWGRKSDFWGRRPVILIGLFGYAVSLGALALVTEMGLAKVWPLFFVYPLMVLSRLIFGVIGSGSVPAAQAYVTDRTNSAERSNGLARMAGAFGFGSMIGPAVGGLLVAYGFLAPIYFVALLAFLSGLLIWYYLPERSKPRQSETVEKISFMTPELIPFILGMGVVGVTMAVSQQVLAYYTIDVLHMSNAEAASKAGIGLMFSAGTALLAQLVIMPRLNLSPGMMVKLSLLLLAISFVVMAISGDFIMLTVAMAIYGLGFGMSMPALSSAASLSVDSSKQGAAAGLMGSSHAVGNIIGSVVGLWLYKYSVTGPYIMTFVLCALFLIYAVITPRINVAVQQPTIPAKG